MPQKIPLVHTNSLLYKCPEAREFALIHSMCRHNIQYSLPIGSRVSPHDDKNGWPILEFHARNLLEIKAQWHNTINKPQSLQMGRLNVNCT